jgi:hypothetical protein
MKPNPNFQIKYMEVKLCNFLMIFVAVDSTLIKHKPVLTVFENSIRRKDPTFDTGLGHYLHNHKILICLPFFFHIHEKYA